MTTPTYPGVYIREIPSSVRTISGVATSITAFVGRALRGPTDRPLTITSWGDFERRYGGLWRDSTLSYAVQQFYQNGGSTAVICRLANSAASAAVPLAAGAGSLTLTTANEGVWGDALRATVDHDTADASDTALFNLTIEEVNADGQVVAQEVFRNVSVAAGSPRGVDKVLAAESAMARVSGSLPSNRPDAAAGAAFTGGSDGSALVDASYLPTQGQANKADIYMLERTDLFNLLCVPPPTRTSDTAAAVWSAALQYCYERRAILIVDAPSGWNSKDAAEAGIQDTVAGLGALQGSSAINAAVYFPQVQLADPLQEFRLEPFPPCGVVAGTIARTDGQRGVWKAPAGLDASLTGVRALSVELTDLEHGFLNPLGLNALRTFTGVGNVVWGARTLRGSDRFGSEWKYLPVRRLALFIEESLFRGTQWVVFEPNDEPLWSQIRLNVGSFMHNLFRQGAFQGSSPRDAYLVKCDSETTTQDDINRGIVNILVAFAPVKPAEFVVIQIAQLAGQGAA